MTFVDNGDGTGTLAGTPAAGTGGTYAITFTAANGVATDAVQAFTLTVNQAPGHHQRRSDSVHRRRPRQLHRHDDRVPRADHGPLGGATLPAGVTFVDNGDGTGTLSGTPAAGNGGDVCADVHRDNGAVAAVQNFTLTVSGAPDDHQRQRDRLHRRQRWARSRSHDGHARHPRSRVTGTLPAGVTFVDNGNGTGTLSGTPAAGTGGRYPLTFTAANGVLPDGTQAFTLTVNQAPAITSAASATFTVGAAGIFTVTTTGFPAPTLTRRRRGAAGGRDVRRQR